MSPPRQIAGGVYFVSQLSSSIMMADQDQIIGCLLGTAVGDALGLPYEGLSRRRAAKVLGAPSRYRFVFGRGMVSDDTEHACMVAQALIGSGGDVDLFVKQLSRSLRFWLLGLPAGIGLATLRSIIRLWLGYRPHRSGVFSAGNGPAMRAAILGVSLDDPRMLRELVEASTRLTHTDPKAEYGAIAVALAAQMSRRTHNIQGNDYLDRLRELLDGKGDELISLLCDACTAASNGSSTQAFADSLGLSQGISGYVYHTVPVVIHAWLTYPHNYRAAVMSVIECGGDADTTAAIVGGIVGAAVGKPGIPAEWLTTMAEWPRSISWMERLGKQLHTTISRHTRDNPIRLPFIPCVMRNLVFLMIVLFHGFRRLIPPY